MPEKQPRVVILAGPNGAGKSTSAAKLLLGPLQVTEFVNADVIAQGLSAFAQQNVAMQAGRVMLRRLQQLAAARQDFAFETTLATRSYSTWLPELQKVGYAVDLLFLWLPSAEMAMARVADRVRAGGHHVPDDVIARRYRAGLRNLTQLYIPLVDSWNVIDTRRSRSPRPIAAGGRGQVPIVFDREAWFGILAEESS
jgi:predicted ABC-type ATPase